MLPAVITVSHPTGFSPRPGTVSLSSDATGKKSSGLIKRDSRGEILRAERILSWLPTHRIEIARRRTSRNRLVARVEEVGGVPVSSSKTTALPLPLPIPLALPSLEAKALALFVKRVDFETVASLSAVTVVSDGKSEADLIWQALIALRSALAAADANHRR